MMDPAAVGEFVRSYHDRLDAHLSAEDARREGLRKDLARIDKEVDALVSAVKAGILSDRLQAEFDRLEGNERAIEQEHATEPPPPVRLHPNLAGTAPRRSWSAVSGQPCGRLRVRTEVVGSSPFTIAASRVQRLSATASEMRPIAC